jgi:hypothetical protein
MTSVRIENAICTHICQREPTNPDRYDDLKAIIAPLLPAGENADFTLSAELPAMIDGGQIESFEDDERGMVYVRAAKCPTPFRRSH